MNSKRFKDWLMERLVFISGGIVVILIGAVFYYLIHESRYAFDQTFSYGYRFALQSKELKPDPYTNQIVDDLTLDPFATLLTANPEGADGLDENEEAVQILPMDELSGSTSFVTATSLETDLSKVQQHELYRDNWTQPKHANKGTRYLLFAFAMPDFNEQTMKLAWEPDASFLPSIAPYDIKLRLIQAPTGVSVNPIEVDLKQNPRGKLELPAWHANADKEKINGYVFEMLVTPKTNNFFATIGNFFKTDWAPTLQYPRFGFVPIFLATILMALLALLFAVPVGIAAATWLSELAPNRIREWVKPIVEMLASVPTVVLGYFGLMIVAPGIIAIFGKAFVMESGRCMLTASIVLGFLLLPTIISISEDALKSVPNSLRDGAFALGLTAKETIKRIVVVGAKPGIVAAVLLTFARAIGETMIVWILSGGTVKMPSINPVNTLVSSTRGMPDTTMIEMGNVEFEGVHYGHLFLIGLVLFLFSLAVNLVGYRFGRKKLSQV